MAEVLITLGIIGVVAALTIPTLVQNYKKKIVETKLTKFYSTINQAIELSEVEHGEFDGWADDTRVWLPDDNSYAEDVSKDSIAWFNIYLKPYLKVTCNPELFDAKNLMFYNKDDSNLKFFICSFNNGEQFAIRSDTNREWFYFVGDAQKCSKDEKAAGKCAFPFLLSVNYITTPSSDWKYHYRKKFEPYMFRWDGENDTLYENCKDIGSFCGALIKQNGWKVPDDYPHKF